MVLLFVHSQVIQHWVDTWTANTTQDEFKEVLEALCKKLDRTSRVKHCLHIVDDYYIPWFNFLLHEVNPKLICGMVGLCGGNGFMKVGSYRMKKGLIHLLSGPETFLIIILL